MSGKILLVAPLPPPIGGDTVSTTRLLESRYWEDAGYEIECINTSAGEGVKPAEVKRTWKDPFRAIKIICQIVVKLPGADIMLLWANSSFIVSLGIPVMRLSRILRKPFIVKPFGTMLADRISELGGARRKTVVSLLNRAEYLLPQTQMHADELVARAGLDPERIVPFPNFLPDSSFAEYRLGRKFSGRCVFIGQIKEEKGVFDIIEALKDSKGLSCDYYGQIIARDNERFFEEIGSCSACQYRGTLSNEEIIDALERYDVLLLPSRHPGEGYPAVIIEAFAAGIPVIATDWKSLPELVEDGKRGILVPLSSPEKISEALARLADDDDLYDSISHNVHEYVKGFTEKAVVNDLLVALVRKSIER